MQEICNTIVLDDCRDQRWGRSVEFIHLQVMGLFRRFHCVESAKSIGYSAAGTCRIRIALGPLPFVPRVVIAASWFANFFLPGFLVRHTASCTGAFTTYFLSILRRAWWSLPIDLPNFFNLLCSPPYPGAVHRQLSSFFVLRRARWWNWPFFSFEVRGAGGRACGVHKSAVFLFSHFVLSPARALLNVASSSRTYLTHCVIEDHDDF
jgi:hypothetical protein